MHPLSTDDPLIWRTWYDRARWKRMARQQMQLQPLCEMHLAKGQTVAATTADHCIPHRGDWELFWTGKLQSLCSQCHSGEKRQVENKGYTTAIDESGWPVDERHPARKVK